MSGPSRYGRAGDVRGYYAQLGVTLAADAATEAAARCFADLAEHRRGDRSPSCSVNVSTGAWLCHGCGARGGAYDAALLHHRTPRQAIDLMIQFGLAERRPTNRHAVRSARRTRSAPASRPPTQRFAQPRLEVADAELDAWSRRLAADAQLLGRLQRINGWAVDPLAAHGVGWDGKRVTIPARDHEGRLVAVYRYAPRGRRRTGPKVVALPGSRRALFPSPAALPPGVIWIAEGQPDALAALSAGVAAVGIPGVWGWDPGWASLFAGRDVMVCMDADAAGRAAARRIADDVLATAARVRVADVASNRSDGYDLSDLVRAAGPSRAGEQLRRLAARAA